MDMFVVHPFDPADRNHMVFEAAGEIEFGEFNLVAEDMIDATDVAAENIGDRGIVVTGDLFAPLPDRFREAP